MYKKFPILNLLNNKTDGSLSEIKIATFYENLASNIDKIYGNNFGSQLKVEPEIVCGSYWQQVKLAACSGTCGIATAGAASVLCLWGCWCMLCTENSAVYDAIC